MDRIYRVRQGMGGRYVIERDNALYWLEGDVFGDYRAGGGIDEPLRDFVAPVMPSKIMAIGLNYKDHAAEMKKALPAEPLLFIKPPTTVIGPEQPIQIPAWPGRIEHEAEMAVVIGRRAIAGQGPRRDGLHPRRHLPVRRHRPRAAGQGRAGTREPRASTPSRRSGPCIAVGLDPSELEVEGWVNGQKRQHSNTRELIFPVPEVVEWLTRFCTLEPGDVITTGTPSGVGPLVPGDRMMVKVQGVGALSNPCVEA